MAAAGGKAVMAAAWMHAARGGSRRARGQGRGGGPACVGRAALGARSTGEEGRRERGGREKEEERRKWRKENGKKGKEKKKKKEKEREREKREIRGEPFGHAALAGSGMRGTRRTEGWNGD